MGVVLVARNGHLTNATKEPRMTLTWIDLVFWFFQGCLAGAILCSWAYDGSWTRKDPPHDR